MKDSLDDRVVVREVEEVSLDAIVEEDLEAEGDEVLAGDEAEDDTFVEEEEEELSDFIRGDLAEDDEA
jgi:hypothetical protein